MKKRILIITVIIAIIFLVAVVLVYLFINHPVKKLNVPDDVSMIIIDDTLSNTEARITITANNNNKYILNNKYWIDQLIDGKWYRLNPKNDTSSILMAYHLPYNNVIKWETVYGKLDTGEYRIVKEIFLSNDYNQKYDIYARFTLD